MAQRRRPAADLLKQLRDAHPESGLWPVLVGAGRGRADGAAPARWWQLTNSEFFGHPHIEAFGDRCPRPAPPGRWSTSASAPARCPGEILADPVPRAQRWRLGLAPAEHGADAPAVAGWTGAINLDDRRLARRAAT